ncbi:helix-turn-helix domain-containing protein [Actinomadura sp. LOL_016]|uniref:helix-turn-helix domain-containing protein n=1 Tax=unclassified Actinomadura TaxID=2626254 RepID=UPI003A7F91B0
MKPGPTAAEIRSLPATIDLVTAGAIFGIGRTTAYRLARIGEFPCRVLRVGRTYRVPTAAVLAALGLGTDDEAGRPGESGGQPASQESD